LKKFRNFFTCNERGGKRRLTIDTGAGAIPVLVLPRYSVADACAAAEDGIAAGSAPQDKRRRIRTLALAADWRELGAADCIADAVGDGEELRAVYAEDGDAADGEGEGGAGGPAKRRRVEPGPHCSFGKNDEHDEVELRLRVKGDKWRDHDVTARVRPDAVDLSAYTGLVALPEGLRACAELRCELVVVSWGADAAAEIAPDRLPRAAHAAAPRRARGHGRGHAVSARPRKGRRGEPPRQAGAPRRPDGGQEQPTSTTRRGTACTGRRTGS
jgi:hypothetical protein